MATKKKTKVEMFAEIKEVLTDKDQIAFIDHEIELVTKKNASKSTSMTPRQKENAGISEDILASMSKGVKLSITDIMKVVPSIAEMGIEICSPQRVTSIVSGMVKDGKLVRIVEKGKALFFKP